VLPRNFLRLTIGKAGPFPRFQAQAFTGLESQPCRFS
jgi:hypothetical protein